MAKVKKTAKVVNSTTNQTRWEDEDDLEKDLYSISDFGQPFKDNSSPSIYVRKARTKSIYDVDDDLESDDMVPMSCGRGRMMLMNTKGVRNSSFLKQQSETSQEIRLTSSGYGYCNDQIEHALNCNTPSPRPNATISSTLSNGTTSKSSNEVSNRPLMPLCDIVRSGVRMKQEVYKPAPDSPIDINSLKEFPKL